MININTNSMKSNNKLTFESLPYDILGIIINQCISIKFIIHFISKKFYKLTDKNKENIMSNVCFNTIFKDKFFMNITHSVFENVAINGDFDLLKWMHNLNYPLDIKITQGICKSGKSYILKWALDNNCDWDCNVLKYIAANGNTEMMDQIINSNIKKFYALIKEDNKDNYISNYLFQQAISNNDIDILYWLTKKGFTINSTQDMIKKAMLMCDFDFIKYIIQDHSRSDSRICALAATVNNLELLQHVHSLRFQWNRNISTIAALNGNLEMLKWLYKKGCELNHTTFLNALCTGQISILKWLHKKNCAFIKHHCIQMASFYKYDNIKQWIEAI